MERSTRYLNNLEHDRSEPRFTTILLLADAIGMQPGELVNAAAVNAPVAYRSPKAYTVLTITCVFCSFRRKATIRSNLPHKKQIELYGAQ